MLLSHVPTASTGRWEKVDHSAQVMNIFPIEQRGHGRNTLFCIAERTCMLHLIKNSTFHKMSDHFIALKNRL